MTYGRAFAEAWRSVLFAAPVYIAYLVATVFSTIGFGLLVGLVVAMLFLPTVAMVNAYVRWRVGA